MPSLSQRLRALAKLVEACDRRFGESPTPITDAAFLGLVSDSLLLLEAMAPDQERGGRPKTRGDENLYLLEMLVEEGKRRWHCKTDRAALEHVVRHIWGYKAESVVRGKAHTLQNLLAKARKLPR